MINLRSHLGFFFLFFWLNSTWAARVDWWKSRRVWIKNNSPFFFFYHEDWNSFLESSMEINTRVKQAKKKKKRRVFPEMGTHEERGMKKGAQSSRSSCVLPFSTTLREELQEKALGEAPGNGKNNGGASSCCWTALSSSDTWHKKGIKFQMFSLPGSWVRGIRELDAESWLGDGEFQIRGSHKAKLFPPPDTEFPSFPLFQSLVSISPHYSLTSESKFWVSPSKTWDFFSFLASKALKGL